MQDTCDISILIVCYRSEELIEACLEGVFKHIRGVSFEVLVVDCSADGTVDIVRREFPAVRVIENSENLGFARGNNVLARHARGRYLLLLNPDTIVTDDAIVELYQCALAWPSAGAVGGRCRLPDGSRDAGCRQVIPSLGRMALITFGMARFLNGGLPEHTTEPAEVETLSGAFMLVRSDAWREIGGFDESFFMYSEEVDLCERLRRAGYQIVMTPRAEIIHLVGSGGGANPARTLMFTRARMHFFRKHLGRRGISVAGGLLWLHGAMRWAIGTVASWVMPVKCRRLRECYAGIVWNPKEWWYGYAEQG